MPDRARELRAALVDAREVCRRLGLDEGAQPQARGVLIRCPWHADRTPSCSVREASDGTIAVKCHGCDRSGDVLHLVAAVHGLDVRRDFTEVLNRAGELAGDARGDALVRPRMPPREREPERTYPPADELACLWNQGGSVVADPEVAACLRGRGLDADHVHRLDLARALPVRAAVPAWASYKRQPWPRTGHRLLVPAFDAHGAMRSLRAWRVVDSDTPKRLPPAGHRLGGLVLADAAGVALLCGAAAAPEAVIVEGEPDLLTWATWLAQHGRAGEVAVFGIFAGGWTTEVAARIPDATVVYVRTDHDEAGERYAAVINETLGRRCNVRRLVSRGGRTSRRITRTITTGSVGDGCRGTRAMARCRCRSRRAPAG